MNPRQREPTAELQPEDSSDAAAPTPWAEGHALMERAEVYWLATARPHGRPHITPVIAAWLDGALSFCTGASERKAKNLAANAHCVVTTGRNTLSQGLDVVIEADAVRVGDESTLRRLADRYASKHDWRFAVRDGAFHGNAGETLVFAVTPTTAFGFGKDDPFGQARWRFSRAPAPDDDPRRSSDG